MLKEQLAARLEQAFSELGLAQPNVTQLKVFCCVSRRTLYKYFSSKEEMIIAALDYRHRRYLQFLTEDCPGPGSEAIVHVFSTLGVWLERHASKGCMSMNAIAAFPDNINISRIVRDHKEDVRQVLEMISKRSDLASQFFVIHEGLLATWPLIGDDALESAKLCVANLLSSGK
ncbi:TetR/AcrR family transcriptional regulator [Vibrio cincinnatiensis]|uniref:TetR/AcrR family transcriptional regulator n=1 Tax=Vibrio cincinnatiensis TaxID=675 RepID=UPI001EE067AC|nr:TetR/AcrR family transcriptional regulator [Vibrio cincinnatiensis]MCG3734340.1 TetR/AcrR family transcriptional regulator [Vibrio cincinnatiensis]MCG3741443.1 TetR/AcrR family transcriptional regulator [Vibrio cincinnatiensis]MCG3745147.1 TetR/AcrR family transcriptional regulator [Vibrio cincinnatiensis]